MLIVNTENVAGFDWGARLGPGDPNLSHSSTSFYEQLLVVCRNFVKDRTAESDGTQAARAWLKKATHHKSLKSTTTNTNKKQRARSLSVSGARIAW